MYRSAIKNRKIANKTLYFSFINFARGFDTDEAKRHIKEVYESAVEHLKQEKDANGDKFHELCEVVFHFISFLEENAKDAAEIQEINTQSLRLQ